jgi:HTH-type transcriptional repressor of NAD biosynthesis genes
MSSKPFQHGLVIGKFYPPHLGHVYLIRTAAQHSGHATVLVLGSSVESISIAQRVDWLRATFADTPNIRIVGELDDVPVDYTDAEIWQAHVDIMHKAIHQANQKFGVKPAIDAVFSSEPYGDELAKRLGCKHVCLDQRRSLYPTSGTLVRQDLTEQWGLLPPAVKAGLAMRVVVVGAESTGTTTLSIDLVKALRTRGGIWQSSQWVAEYGREYSANMLAICKAGNTLATPNDIRWQSDDFVHVAQVQCLREEEFAAVGSPILVCDTDAFATRVWHERYMESSHPEVEAIANAMPSRGLYILTSEKEVGFEDDGLRDGEHLRGWMNQRFRDLLNQQKSPWIEVHGTPPERCQVALAMIDKLMASQWSFAPPLQPKDFESH